MGNALAMGLLEGDFWARHAGCYTVYRGLGGDFDYDNILAVMNNDDSTVTILGQDLTPEASWHYTRRAVSCCGLESPDAVSACVITIDAAGDSLGARPNAPVDLAVEYGPSNTATIRWRYNPIDQGVEPDVFNIYVDSGSGFDWDTPADTKAVTTPELFGGQEFSWQSSTLTHGQTYRFCVRAANSAAGESQNIASVHLKGDTVGPSAPPYVHAVWEVL